MKAHRISRKALPLALLPVAAAGVVFLLVPTTPPPPRENLPRLVAPAPDRVATGDGSVVRGEVQSHSGTHTTVRLPDGTVRLLTDVSEVKRGSPRRGPRRRVTLRNGRSLIGEVLGEGSGAVELRLESGTLVTLRPEDVERVDEPPQGK